MFGRLQRRFGLTKKAPSVPDGVRVYAIGDVHGCAVQLGLLLAQISKDALGFDGIAHLVFVGDLVDRGPASCQVLEWLRSGPLPCDRHHFVMGNHEEAMLEVWNGDAETLHGWLTYGGRETLESYGVDRSEIVFLGGDIVGRMREAVPFEHIAFIQGFEDQVRIGDYLFVHAGVRPGVPLDQQDPYDLRWIRQEFLQNEAADHGAVVVHGHTICAEPELRANRIGIDTGCFKSGRLTALVLEGEGRRFLST